ncbi:hypothetical protein BJ875DRAFT_232749 [Amylocarpus encephaloides]|uniref:Uncharacterized protein n=1 Tax=Amylocarpus encephaloides TaxID=45428 RepID=A0A9P7YMQ6_9HELO|nr:hypothetical protein BJ875DRAFT_232749 [Amylocarpus encephaloides]
MEKIKNILSGKHKHDEKTHQSGHNTSTATPSTAPTAGTVSGQGSHFGGETRTGMTGVTGSQVSSHMPGEFPADASAAGYSTAATQPGDGQEPPTTAGLHSSSKASRADPRVDPDLDNSQTVGKAGAYSNTQGTGYDSGVGSTGGSSTTASPQLSNVANKSNPRDDSDLDGSRTADNFGTSVTNTGSAAVGSTTAPRGFPLGSSAGSTNAGPRPSNMPNQADPRVDPDRDGPRAAGNTAGTAAIGGTTTARSFPLGGTSSSTSSGLHSSDLANKADPRVDSDNSRLTGISESTMGRSHPLHSGSGNTSVTSTGSGTSTTGHTLTTTGSGHHLGRDAAAVGTAAAAGEGVHHRNKQSSLGSTTEPSGIASSSLHTASGASLPQHP